jgi:hypothetical protein
MNNFHFRASGIAEIMGDGKGADGLSVTAKTYLNGIAKEYVYSYHKVLTSKYFDKGLQCEDSAIDLYNDVFFTNHVKNTERRSNDWITGEPDIIVPGKQIIDIKNAWSLDTFPATSAEVADIAKKSGYDYQGRAYMWLFDVDEFEVAYCLVSTPSELCRYEQQDLHDVEHINPALRITRSRITRDRAIEEKMKAKVLVARDYIENYVALINLEHREAA